MSNNGSMKNRIGCKWNYIVVKFLSYTQSTVTLMKVGWQVKDTHCNPYRNHDKSNTKICS